MVRLRYGNWNIACRKNKTIGGFTAFGSRKEIPDRPITLKGDLYFNFADTQEKAIAKMKEEIDTLEEKAQ